MFKKPTISKTVEEEIRKLESEGIKLTPNEIVYLYTLGEMASRPNNDKLLDYCYKSYGNYRCYPLSIGAKLWLQYLMKELPSEDQLIEMAAFYAYANSRNMDAFKFDSIPELKRVVREFASNINITDEEMARLITDISTAEIEYKKAHNDEKEADLYPALALLINTFGKDKNYWLWEESCDNCERMIKEAISIKMEKANAKGKLDTDDNSVLAFYNLKKVVKDIRESRIKELATVDVKPIDTEVKDG